MAEEFYLRYSTMVKAVNCTMYPFW